MKKLLFILLVLLTLSGIALASAETKTTVMVYMSGSDISNDALSDVSEMIQGVQGDAVTITLLAGGSNSWSDLFTPRKLNRCVISNRNIRDLETLSNRNMGNTDTVVDFLDWSVSRYPADRYMLIFWDHGGGSASGVCWDETNNSDYLSPLEINKALETYRGKNPDFHLDWIGFDACLMGSYETAAHMASFADYFIASEDLEPGYGWYYKGWLQELCANPEMDSQSVAVSIANHFVQFCLREEPSTYVSLSITYLPAMTSMIEKMEAYAGELVKALENGELSSLSRARSGMYTFGSFYDYDSGCVDLAAFMNATREIAPEAAAEALAAYQQAVRYSVGSKQYDYLTGLSIFFPESRSELKEVEMNETIIPKQIELFRSFAARGNGQSWSFNQYTPSSFGSDAAQGYGYSTPWGSWGNDGYGPWGDWGGGNDTWGSWGNGGYDSWDNSGYDFWGNDGYDSWGSDGYDFWGNDSTGSLPWPWSIWGDDQDSASSGSWGNNSSGSQSWPWSIWGDQTGSPSSGSSQPTEYVNNTGSTGESAEPAQESTGSAGDTTDTAQESTGNTGESTEPAQENPGTAAESTESPSAVGEALNAQVGPILPESVEAIQPMEWSNPIGGYTITLSPEELPYLAGAKGLMFWDASDDEMFMIIELGAYQNVSIDWEQGTVTSLFDGNLPFLGEEPVAMYDLINTSQVRRSVIPVRYQEKDGYLILIHTPANADWVVVGFSEGYDENGMPARGSVQLAEGDIITPLYKTYILTEEDEDLETYTLDGNPITVGREGQIPLQFVDMSQKTSSTISYMFSFELTNIYGEKQVSDLVDFEM